MSVSWLSLKRFWLYFYAVVTCERNYFEIISVFYFTRNHVWNWNTIISATEIISATPNMFENIHELQ